MFFDFLSSCYKKFHSNNPAAQTEESARCFSALIKSPKLQGRDAAEALMNNYKLSERHRAQELTAFYCHKKADSQAHRRAVVTFIFQEVFKPD